MKEQAKPNKPKSDKPKDTVEAVVLYNGLENHLQLVKVKPQKGKEDPNTYIVKFIVADGSYIWVNMKDLMIEINHMQDVIRDTTTKTPGPKLITPNIIFDPTKR